MIWKNGKRRVWCFMVFCFFMMILCFLCVFLKFFWVKLLFFGLLYDFVLWFAYDFLWFFMVFNDFCMFSIVLCFYDFCVVQWFFLISYGSFCFNDLFNDVSWCDDMFLMFFNDCLRFWVIWYLTAYVFYFFDWLFSFLWLD